MLTDTQADFVHRAAALLPVSAQPQFMRSVANMLSYAEFQLNDRDVLDCLRLVLAERGISIGNVLPTPQREYAHMEGKSHHDASTPQVFRP